ncbi:tetratricopeptide repeat protein [uncultured Megasphaera sp.]|uniref:tetratricopeptide repeat protein n=1 Tax=uncultured Megasphaera sp. TaxID=165188 RepID=UPI0028688C06|nr:tetratricopeptide repeat protein [uncultured Megasphaera sp.]
MIYRTVLTALLCASLSAGAAAASEVMGAPQVTAAVTQAAVPVQTDWQTAKAYTRPMLDPAKPDYTIMGKAEIPAPQMVRFIRQRNPHPKINTTLEDLVQTYYDEAGREGIRADVALCQALKETGYFNYGGDVSPDQNNFCGLGATGNKVAGARFATPRLGVRAHIQHLLAYASTTRPQTDIVDPRYELMAEKHPDLYGQVPTWTGLNGRWAVPGKHYGQEILWLWTEAQTPDGIHDNLITGFEKVFAQPDDAQAYLYRGILFFDRQDYWLAERDFRHALELDGTSPAAWYDLALTQEKRGQLDAALQSYDQAVACRPEYLEAWYNRGLLALTLGKDNEALRSFCEILRFSPQSADAANAIAVYYLRRHDDAKGRDYLNQAARINTNNPRVRENLQRLSY